MSQRFSLVHLLFDFQKTADPAGEEGALEASEFPQILGVRGKREVEPNSRTTVLVDSSHCSTPEEGTEPVGPLPDQGTAFGQPGGSAQILKLILIPT